jgi:hypothetical protein
MRGGVQQLLLLTFLVLERGAKLMSAFFFINFRIS